MREQLTLLRHEMARYNIQAYLIPTDDFHGSEYVGDHFKCRSYVSGFTGSAGTLLVMEDMAGLWTDGRYFLQAAAQLRGSGITLFKMGEPGVPSVKEYLREHLTRGMTFGFDGRCMMDGDAIQYAQIAREKEAYLDVGQDLVGIIWSDRPALSHKPAWILEERYSGRSCRDKLEELRHILREEKAEYHLLASLDDICWLLNVRGDDVESTPVILGYLLMSSSEITWYVQEACLDDSMKAYLAGQGIQLADYDQIYEDLKILPADSSILYDEHKTNAALSACIPQGMTRIIRSNPTELMKARKNPVEVENERIAHIKDGVALSRFMYYLKTRAVAEGETEISLADHLIRLRREQGDYIEESFAPIIGYGDHGAIVHYSANPETDRPMEARSFVLVDTGGHYLQGTTDTTRTFVMGPLSDKEKEMYTAVLRGHINLAAARFLPGCSGQSLDILARGPLWDMGYEYNHGTGHGVGYLLNVHEGPNSFRIRSMPSRPHDCIMEAGMITSDEPGVYLEGEFGIRLENLIVCLQDPEYKDFLCFEPLTMVPFEREAILPERMTAKEIAWLDAYHQKVYEKIAPFLPEEERIWLRDITRPLER